MANFEDFLKSSDLGHRYPAITTFFQKRRELLYSPAVLAGYLIDPRYNGARLTADQKLQATIWLSQMLDAQAYDEWLSYRAIDDRQLRSSIDKYIASESRSALLQDLAIDGREWFVSKPCKGCFSIMRRAQFGGSRRNLVGLLIYPNENKEQVVC
jgi:hypothetical protein